VLRLAEIKDIPSIVKLFAEQRPETHLAYAEKGFSPSKCANLTKGSIQQGYAWVYDTGIISGMLLAEKRLNMFSDTIVEAAINVLYVTPNYRKGIAAGRMLKAFLAKCEEEKIKMVWIGSSVKSSLTEESLSKYGFKLQEQFYLKETI